MDDNSTGGTWPEFELQLQNLKAIKVLGKGATGTVFLVHDMLIDPSATFPFALKVVEKSLFPIKPDSDRRSRWEISVLNQIKELESPHPFLPYLLGTAETEDYLCWATPYCPGGDLNVLRFRQSDRVFSPFVIRFYLAEIICALEKLHELGIAYRDLKPENILIQHSGHITLSDFDLSRSLSPRKKKTTEFMAPRTEPLEKQRKQGNRHRRNLTRLVNLYKKKETSVKKAKSARVSPVTRKTIEPSDERSNSFVGTEEYVAPEVISGEGHEFSVDWWALGILCYEMLYGTTPFKGKNRKETFRKILLMEPEFVGKPNSLTDLITKLLEKDPTRRLGYRRGASEIKEHEFFKGLRWDLLTEVSRPPFLPSRDETDLMEELKKGGMDIREYFEKLKTPPSPLWSPSIDECRRNVSLTEF
ncbi:OLC1v1005743C1 [Oldenlandia corymbosa var. corymbosa]|uniref:non-specific serine/threonine protein kinase n=1 Tax=Oldenlandia corymbosa var. corymbosa TaxID=529605 RepID=A0AAV1DFB2_OLDCO|nr:OLC1v1005743C1 [Oldenlandia corymbosa var. corymbosa]